MTAKWSPEFQEILGFIADTALQGDYDDRTRQRRLFNVINSNFVQLVMCDEGGTTREVGDGEKTLHTLTYLARADIWDDNASREYWLLDDGRVFQWTQSLAEGRQQVREFVGCDVLPGLLAEIQA